MAYAYYAGKHRKRLTTIFTNGCSLPHSHGAYGGMQQTQMEPLLDDGAHSTQLHGNGGTWLQRDEIQETTLFQATDEGTHDMGCIGHDYE